MTAQARVERSQALAAFALYLALAILLFDRGLVGQSGSYFVGRETDPGVYMWFFRWWRYALMHSLNPFITDVVWTPVGINLAWTTCVPLPAWLSFPLEPALGEPTTYSVIVSTMPPLAALSAFLLCRRITGAFWPSILGGYLFGFSPHMLGEMLGHLVLVAIFPVPLFALLTLRRFDDAITSARYSILIATLLIVQFLCSVELFATVTMVGGFALLLAVTVFPPEIRRKLIALLVPTFVAYVIAAAILSPYFYYLLAFGTPGAPIWTPSRFSADVVGFLVPRETIWLGTMSAARTIASNFGGYIYENGDYLGIALIALVEAFRRRYWRDPAGKFLVILLVAIVVAAMGPTLHVAGKQGLVMPGVIFQWLPLVSNLLPVRLTMYAFLVIAVMASMWFASWQASRTTKCAAAALILLSIAPNPHASFWVSRIDLPEFFASGGDYKRHLQPGEIIMPVPLSQEGNSMYWQSETDMYFRMAGGWTGVSPFEFERMPLVNYLHGAIDLPEAPDQLKAYIARFGVQAIIADPTEEHFAAWQPTLDALGVPSGPTGGIWIYKIPTFQFARYAQLTGAQVEARAVALRFDAILEAAGKYLAGGHPPAAISALELKQLDLLPHDWQVATKPGAFADWSISALPDGRYGIALIGSIEGVTPLIDRYASASSEILYPAPARWKPAAARRKDLMSFLIVEFDRPQLEAAATALATTPPPERTTPFIGGWPSPSLSAR